jgi:hypothetical protein
VYGIEGARGKGVDKVLLQIVMRYTLLHTEAIEEATVPARYPSV